MLYLLNHICWFFLPGLLLAYLFRPNRQWFLSSFALSYGLLLLILLPLEFYGAEICWFTRLMRVALLSLIILAFLKLAWQWRRGRWDCGRYLGRWRRRSGAYLVALGLLALFGLYWFWAGPYTEIPADFWAHLGRVQDQSRILETGRFPGYANFLVFISHQGPHWYFIVAWLCQQSGTSIAAALEMILLANAVTFLLALFSFGLVLFRRWRYTRLTKTALAALAALLGVAHLGVNVFSYVRYYTLAPALLNYGVFLAAAAAWIVFVEGTQRAARGLWVLPFYFCSMVVIHTQEAMFAGMLIMAVSLAAALLAWRRGPGWRAGVAWRRTLPSLLLGLLWLGVFCWMRWQYPALHLNRAELLPVTRWLPFFSDAFILHPAGQFFQAFTLWGVFIYLAFLWRLPLFLGSAAIVGGMLIPLLTVFNPFLVDMFLRYQATAPLLLYRFAYIIPLAYVAAALSGEALRYLFQPLKAGAVSHSWRRRLGGGIFLIGLVALLHPGLGAGHSRWPTLAPVAARNSEALWADLTAYLQTLPRCQLLSDPVTLYVVGGLTPHRVLTDKFMRPKRVLHVAPGRLTPVYVFRDILDELDDSWLVIINQRDGAPSRVGQISGHWPGNILEVSRYYPPLLLDYIRAQPELFAKIWEEDRIAVYAIRSAAVRAALPLVPELLLVRPQVFSGPGMHLRWTPCRPQGFMAYHIQVSEDGQHWRDLRARREYRWPWFNHIGAKTNVFGKWSRCLPAGQTYHYRVRALYEGLTGEWSKVESGRVPSYR